MMTPSLLDRWFNLVAQSSGLHPVEPPYKGTYLEVALGYLMQRTIIVLSCLDKSF